MTKITEKIATDQWVWLQDYANAKADWTVNCPPDRLCQVGMGIKMFGKPRGEKLRFSGFQEFVTFGIGAIHVRVVDGKGDCLVRLDQGKVGLIDLTRLVPLPDGFDKGASLPPRRPEADG